MPYSQQKRSLNEGMEPDRLQYIRDRQDAYRMPLNIPTPVVKDKKLLKKWHGMPPRKLTIEKRRGGTVVF